MTSYAVAMTTQHVHFNNAGASPSPPKVLDAVITHMRLESEVGAYRAAELVCDELDEVYNSAAKLIGAVDIYDEDDNDRSSARNADNYNARDEIALVESATVGWTRVFYAMLETKERELISNQREEVQSEAIILVSEAEYAANVVAAVKWAREHTKLSGVKWRVIGIPSSFNKHGSNRSSTGVIHLDSLQTILDGKSDLCDPESIVLICVTHVPTNSGIINPVQEIGHMIHNFNTQQQNGISNQGGNLPKILYLVDACQSVGQLVVDVKKMKCHALTATGRKYLRGPRGTGFLFVKKEIANLLEPTHVDHAAAPILKLMSEQPCRGIYRGLEEGNECGLAHTYQHGAARFEFWESNLANRLGLGAAIDIALAIGMEKIEERCSYFGSLLRKRLSSINGVKLHHDNCDQNNCGIVTFSLDGCEASTMKELLQNDQLNNGSCFHLSVVPATSTPLDSCTGLGEKLLLRASLSYFNTEDEIEKFCRALQSLIIK